jgi:hypothetical protein
MFIKREYLLSEIIKSFQAIKDHKVKSKIVARWSIL